jgi:hypothetical protein
MPYRDKNPNRFKRPGWLDRPPIWDRRESKGLHAPAWFDKRRMRKKDPDRFKLPNWFERSNRSEGNPNRLARPAWLDRIKEEKDPDRLKRPAYLDKPRRRARSDPDRFKRPDVIDRFHELTRKTKVILTCALAVVLGATVLAVRNTDTGKDLGPTKKGAFAGFAGPVEDVSLTGHGMLPKFIVSLPTAGTAIARRVGDAHLYLAERRGTVWTLDTSNSKFTLSPQPVLDIQNKVRNSGLEDGLVGLSFSPDGQALYTSYIEGGNGDLVVSAYEVDKDLVVPTSAREILRVPNPGTSYIGGDIATGPDGMLYVGVGDGGPPGDLSRSGISQNQSEVGGSILRISPNSAPAPGYTIPPDNPYVATPLARAEVWAKGVHLPSGLSWDRMRGLWLLDRGDTQVNEIDHMVGPAAGRGANLGWDLAEGDERLKGIPPADAVRPSIQLPIVSSRPGCQPVGGYFYQSPSVTGKRGAYLFANGCDGTVRAAMKTGNGPNANQVLAISYLAQQEPVTAIGDGGSAGPIILGERGGVYYLQPTSQGINPLVDPAKPLSVTPPSQATDACGLSAAVTNLNVASLRGRSPAEVRQALMSARTSLAAYRGVLPPNLHADLDLMLRVVDTVNALVGQHGYVIDDALVQQVQDAVQPQVLDSDGTGPLANLVAYESKTCPGPKLIDLGSG